MIITCWNCKTEMEKTVEKSGVEEYKSSLLINIKNIEQVFRTVGDTYRADAYQDIVYLIENFE